MADSAAVHCVAFRGFVILLKLEYPRNADSCARIWLYRYTNLSQTFVKVEKTIPLGISGRATVAKFECVLDKTSGLTRPCLLVHQLFKKRSRGAEMTCHVLFLSENFESFLTRGCVNVNRDGVPPEDKLKLFDGPCVCWSSETSVYLISPDFAGNLTVNSHMLTDLIPNVQPDSFIIHWCGNLNGEVVAMGTTQTLTNGTSVSGNGLSLRWTCISLIQGGITVQDMCFIPMPYVSIVTCASVITRHHRVQSAFSRKLGGRSTLSDVAVFVTTNQGQLLEFNNGHLRNCCRLPFVDPCNLWILEAEYGETMLLVQSKNNQVCAINGSECKVVQEWTGITSVLSEDFLGTGTEQLLLSHNGFNYQGNNDPLSHFTLVDIRRGMRTINSKQDFHGKMDPSMEVAEPAGSGAGSLQKTAQALGTRLQVGLTSLAEAQVECTEKLQLIEQSCAVLQNTTSVNGSGQEIPLKSPGHLVSLLDGNFTKDVLWARLLHTSAQEADLNVAHKLQCFTGLSGESSCPVPSDVSVMATATWQRVIDDCWVVAADVKNSGKCPLSDLALALVPQGTEDHTTCTSKPAFTSDCPFPLYSPTSHPHLDWEDIEEAAPARKKPRTCSNQKLTTKPTQRGKSSVLLPGNKVTLLVTSPLPKFSLQPNHSCSLVVTWTSQGKTGGTSRHAMCCGDVMLTVDQVLNGSLDISQGIDDEESSKQCSVLALKSVSIETQLVIQSIVICPWLPATSLLQSAMPLPVVEAPHVFMESSHLPIRVNNAGPLTGAGMMVCPGHKELHVRLWTRNKNQVYLILHKLREILPDNAVIHPDQSMSHVVSSLRTIEQEITALQQGLSELLQDVNQTSIASEQSTDGGPPFDSCNPETKEGRLMLVRKDFERRQSCSSSVKNVRLVQGNKLAEVWQRTFHDQMKTDFRIKRTDFYRK